jgi:hypothetical protein
MIETDKNILKFLLENTEVDSKIVEFNVPVICDQSKDSTGTIVGYVHHPKGIFYVWIQKDPIKRDDFLFVSVYLFNGYNDIRLYSKSCERGKESLDYSGLLELCIKYRL